MAGNVIVKMLEFKSPRDTKRGNHDAANIRYIATRPGTDKTVTDESLSRAADVSMLHALSKNEDYTAYIANRPGVVRASSTEGEHSVHLNKDHGLFGEYGVPDLKELQKEIRRLRNSPMYRFVISLHEDTATSLGYTDKAAWETMIRDQMTMIAENMSIPSGKLGWVAAVHMKDGHPHLHLNVWDKDDKPRRGGILPIASEKLENIKAGITKAIYEQRRNELYAFKNAARTDIQKLIKKDVDSLKEFFKEINDLHNFKIENECLPAPSSPSVATLSMRIIELSKAMPGNGRIAYKLMSPDVKGMVDKIADELMDNPVYKNNLDKIRNVARSLTEQFTSQPERIEEAENNAVADIKKRISQEILHAAAEYQDTYFKMETISSLQTLYRSSNPVDVNPNILVSYVCGAHSCGIDKSETIILLKRSFTHQSITALNQSLGTVSIEDSINLCYNANLNTDRRSWRISVNEILNSTSPKQTNQRNERIISERAALNTSIALMRGVYSLLSRRGSGASRGRDILDVNLKKRSDALFMKHELEQ